MTIQPVSNPSTPIGEILKSEGSVGIVLETAVRSVMPCPSR